jgi:hypothetical protein
MVAVRVDPSGRLLSFRVVPDTLAKTKGPWAEPDWAPLFVASGLTIGEWQPSDPLWAPAQPSDTRRAWTRGTCASRPRHCAVSSLIFVAGWSADARPGFSAGSDRGLRDGRHLRGGVGGAVSRAETSGSTERQTGHAPGDRLLRLGGR